MQLPVFSGDDRGAVFAAVEQELRAAGFRIANKDDKRPWGGFFVIDEAQSRAFIEAFFPEENADDILRGKISPKILLVAPGKRLSWQYHHRRAELWRILSGTVQVAMSDTNEQSEPASFNPDDIVRLRQGQRHRLIGTEHWGVVAEIWQHTDPGNLSDEDDIVRVQDDFGR